MMNTAFIAKKAHRFGSNLKYFDISALRTALDKERSSVTLVLELF